MDVSVDLFPKRHQNRATRMHATQCMQKRPARLQLLVHFKGKKSGRRFSLRHRTPVALTFQAYPKRFVGADVAEISKRRGLHAHILFFGLINLISRPHPCLARVYQSLPALFALGPPITSWKLLARCRLRCNPPAAC